MATHMETTTVASYDKPKLIGMLEARNAAFVQIRDISDRLRVARASVDKWKSHIRIAASQFGASAVGVDHLLGLPLEEALRLSQEEVESYEVEERNGVRKYLTGVNLQNFQSYLNARSALEHLQRQYDAAQADIEARFGIVPKLVEAVERWGFKNPRTEVGL
ncbi:hypothetical protein AZOA_47940 [Azoarcus sp. Aa7]|nr:hypothetical protein [Azoarcus sp. Aa7]